MLIGYVISESFCVSPFNGIRIQAEMWARELERQGHQVTRVNPWEQQNWKGFDAIHLFGYSTMLSNLSRIPNTNIVFSPIIDSDKPVWKYKMASYWGCQRLRLMSHNYEIRLASKHIKRWSVRTRYEFDYVRKGYGIPEDRITINPLSYRVNPPSDYPKKEPFCLHVSKITDSRKNVGRLVDAAIKYGFKLVLAGSTGTNYQFSTLKRKIDENDNIIFLGRVSDAQLEDLYRRAKVFCLPSIGEGVGLVALEAASFGCDIVVTSIGGPKEYYADMAYVVNPYNVDEIGMAVINALQTLDRQPKLMSHIRATYNLQKCVNNLVAIYQ